MYSAYCCSPLLAAGHVGDDCKQHLETVIALRGNDAELGQVRAQPIDGLCTLPHK